MRVAILGAALLADTALLAAAPAAYAQYPAPYGLGPTAGYGTLPYGAPYGGYGSTPYAYGAYGGPGYAYSPYAGYGGAPYGVASPYGASAYGGYGSVPYGGYGSYAPYGGYGAPSSYYGYPGYSGGPYGYAGYGYPGVPTSSTGMYLCLNQNGAPTLVPGINLASSIATGYLSCAPAPQ